MIRARLAIARIEVLCALHIAAFGDWWAVRAGRRMRKLSRSLAEGRPE